MYYKRIYERIYNQVFDKVRFCVFTMPSVSIGRRPLYNHELSISKLIININICRAIAI